MVEPIVVDIGKAIEAQTANPALGHQLLELIGLPTWEPISDEVRQDGALMLVKAPTWNPIVAFWESAFGEFVDADKWQALPFEPTHYAPIPDWEGIV